MILLDGLEAGKGLNEERQGSRETRSIGPQCRDWIDAHRAARGNDAGDDGDGDQESRRPGEGGGVGRPVVNICLKQILHPHTGRPRSWLAWSDGDGGVESICQRLGR